MFSDKRLKERSMSVEIGIMPPSPVTTTARSVVVETPAEEPENHSTNQKLRNWRRAMFKRAFTIDVGLGTHVEKETDRETERQKERKDGKRIPFQRPEGTMEYNVAPNDTLNSIALRFNTTPNELVTRNKLFTRSVVPGKILFVPDPEYVCAAPPSPPSPSPEPDQVKPHPRLTRVASSPHPRLSRLVPSPSEEDEVPTEKFLKVDCKYITDGKGMVGGVLLVTPSFLMFDPDRSDRLVQQMGCEEFGVMCSLEEVMSACACTEVTDPQIRLQLPSNLDLPTPSVSHSNDSASPAQSCSESKQTHPQDLTESVGEGPEPDPRSAPASQEDDQSDCQDAPAPPPSQEDDQSEMDELRKLWKANEEQVEEEARSEVVQCSAAAERSGTSDMRFLCVRVLKPMKKTFVSLARASMQQYALRERVKHQYWFCVPRERSHHILLFFLGEGEGRGSGRGFLVVKRKGGSEPGSDQPPVADISTKDWEVVSQAEYQRRVDALKSDDLRSLCKRLQISTAEELSSGGTEVEPTLSQTSNLLTQEHVHKLAKHLPPRTIGYPWSLAFSTATHGMSINTLYRTMRTLETPVLLVLRDTEGQVFGALASEPLKVSDSFYGTGETFLFTFCPEFEVFKWTGDNMFFLKGDMDSFTFGGGGGDSALWLDGDLYHGRSNPCKTFGNPSLSKKEDFVLQDIEVWSFQ